MADETKTVTIKAEKQVEVPLTENIETEEEIRRMARVIGAYTSSDMKAGENPGGRIFENHITDVVIEE